MQTLHKLALGLATGVIGAGVTLYTQQSYGTDPLTHVFRPVQKIAILPAQAGIVSSLEFSPDGQSIFTSSLISGQVLRGSNLTRSHDIKVWDVATGEALAVLSNPIEIAETRLVAFDATTQRLAFVENEPILERWDLSTGKPLPLTLPKELQNHQNHLITQHLLSDNGLVGAARRYQPETSEWSVLLWELETGATLTSIPLVGGEKLALNQDGSQFAMVAPPPTPNASLRATVWDAIGGNLRYEREISLVGDNSQGQNHSTQTEKLTLSQIGFEGETLWFRYVDTPNRREATHLQQWDLATNTLTAPSNNSELGIAREPQNRGTVYSSNGQRVALRDTTEIVIREVDSDRVLAILETDQSILAFSPNAQTLIGSNLDGSLSAWDITTESERSRIPSRTLRDKRQIRLGEDALLIAGNQEVIRIWNWESGKLLAQVREPEAQWFEGISLIPAGPLVTRSVNTAAINMRLWDVSTAAPIMMLEAVHQGSVASFLVADQGKVAVGGLNWSPGSPIEIWDLGTQTKQVILPELAGRIDNLALGQDRLAVAMGDRIDLISTLTGERVTSVPMSCNGLRIFRRNCWQFLPWTTVMSLSTDGQLLAFVSGRNEITLWHSSRQQVMRRIVLPEDSEPVSSLALSFDGRLLAAGDIMGNLYLWQLPRPLF